MSYFFFWRYLKCQDKAFVFVLYQCAVDLTWFLFISISVLLLILGAVERKGACLPLPGRYLVVIGIILYHPGPGNV